MPPSIQIKRGLASQITSAAGSNDLKVGEPYLITDEARLAVATSTNAFERMAKLSEAGGSSYVNIDGGTPSDGGGDYLVVDGGAP